LPQEQQEILIALLANEGYYGFEEEEDSLSAFIGEKEFKKDAFEQLVGPFTRDYIITKLEEQNWNAKWEEDFKPIIVDDKVAIRAHFHEAFPQIQHEILITPKMSFGTGHHATTHLVIQQMLKLDLNNKSILDFGTGTGILAILAEKLGGSSILAIDNDDWSIENANENIKANNCNEILVEKASTIAPGKVYDVVIANINLNVISDNFGSITNATSNGGDLILSGFLSEDLSAVNVLLKPGGFHVINSSQRVGWLCIHAKRT
jgi:ribosomal protein L11 methyltransferase